MPEAVIYPPPLASAPSVPTTPADHDGAATVSLAAADIFILPPRNPPQPGAPMNCWRVLISFLVLTIAVAGQSAPTIKLSVDATEVPRKIFHARLELPASEGTLT